MEKIVNLIDGFNVNLESYWWFLIFRKWKLVGFGLKSNCWIRGICKFGFKWILFGRKKRLLYYIGYYWVFVMS